MRAALASEDPLVPWHPGRPEISGRELLVVFGGLLAVAAAVYLPHAFSGGFYTDDWFFLQKFHFLDEGLGSVPDMLDVYGSWPGAYRPVQTAMLVAQYLATGDDPGAHLALSVPLAAIQAFLLYLVMRMLGLSRLVAGSAALLLDIGFFIDTTRVWATLQVEMNASSLYLGGLACALHGLRSAVGRRRIAWHAGAIALYLAAAYTYEGMLIAIPLSFLAYLVVARGAAVGRRLLADLAAFGVGALTIAGDANEVRDGEVTTAHLWDRFGEVVPGAVDVLRASVPADGLLFGPLGVVLAILAGVGVWAAVERGGTPGRAARQWCLIATAALVLGFIGLLPLLPGPRYLNPDTLGFANRLVITSAPFYAVLLVAIGFLAGIGFVGLTRRPRLGATVALVLLAAIALHAVIEERQRQADLAATWRAEERIIDRVTETIPDPEPGATMISFGHPLQMPGGFVTFGDYFDLDGALKLAYEDESVVAHPYLPGAVCDEAGISFENITFSPARTLAYDRLYFVDAGRGRSARVRDRAACKRAAGEFLRRRVERAQP
ncbi:MAG TPA: hypothetical protein VF052_07385 [Solirubrobacterales bacterium]